MTSYRVLARLIRPLIWALFRPTAQGVDRLPNVGGFVLSANHLSGFDSLALAHALGGRPVRNMAKNELFARPLLSRLVRLLGAFPAHSGGPVTGGVARAAELAAGGDAVAIFPEGARRRPGRTLRPHTGAARTALAAGVPLVPVALRGTGGWRSLRRWSVAIGAPIVLEDLSSEEPTKAAREATQRLWQAITELEAELQAQASAGSGHAAPQRVAALAAGGRS